MASPTSLCVEILPTPKKDCIFFNKAISLVCKLIEKVGSTPHPNLCLKRLRTFTAKVHSASKIPVTQ